MMLELSLRFSVDQARHWEWPPRTLPLCNDRHPFGNSSSVAISSYFEILRAFPEAYGRLGRFVREQWGIDQPCPTRYVLHEAHIDINEADQADADFLLERGFEPDHFISLNPAEYTKCFTARFEVPADRPDRSRHIGDYLVQMIKEVEERITKLPGRFAYSEVERYTNANKMMLPFRAVSRDGLGTFPFAANEFIPVSEFPKKFDVHVKIPRSERGESFAAASCPEMLILRQLFLAAGFYEIRSMSGNVIYTIQMFDGKVAKEAFTELAGWAAINRGVTSIELEVCKRFWRSTTEMCGREFIAPVPKVVGRLGSKLGRRIEQR